MFLLRALLAALYLATAAHAGGATDTLLRSKNGTNITNAYAGPTVAQTIVATTATGTGTFGAAPSSADMLVAKCSLRSGGGTIAAAAGWTIAYQVSAGAASDGYAVAYRASPGGTTTFTPCTSVSSITMWDVVINSQVWATIFVTNFECTFAAASSGSCSSGGLANGYKQILLVSSAICAAASVGTGVTSISTVSGFVTGGNYSSTTCGNAGGYSQDATFGKNFAVVWSGSGTAVSEDIDAIVLTN